MATRTFTTFLFNGACALIGLAAAAAGAAILLTGVDLRGATSDEAFVVTALPWFLLLVGLFLFSTPFWAHKVR